MRVAALYDIHGNLPALEAVLAEVAAEAPDLILFGGDLAAGPLPRLTLDLLLSLGERARFIRGNADREIVAFYDRAHRASSAATTSDAAEDEPGACWLLLGPGVSLRRTRYDLAAAADQIRRSGYPSAEEFVRENLLQPPSAAEATAIFERLAAERP